MTSALALPPPSTPHNDRFDPRRDRFRLFNRLGGKFRVAVINTCNLDCFFCHNEAMQNPRLPIAGQPRKKRGPTRVGLEGILGIVNAYTRLGGRQVNLTGGEPLAHPRLEALLRGIEKRSTRIALNTNAVLADRLLRQPRFEVVDEILASLHTTDDRIFREKLGGRSVRQVMENIVRLHAHGYEVVINYSLGDYNKDEFPGVLDFALEHGITLKAIAFVRPNEDPDFYRGEWIDPRWLDRQLEARGARYVETKEKFGGRSTIYTVPTVHGETRVSVKNVARGRLETDFCRGCPHTRSCGEGIYGLRSGVDGLWKPCLLRREAFQPIETGRPYEEQILDLISAMVGEWGNAHYAEGKPA